MAEKTYKCELCGFHYKDEKIAKACHNWCSAHQSCSMEITKYSVEMSKNEK